MALATGVPAMGARGFGSGTVVRWLGAGAGDGSPGARERYTVSERGTIAAAAAARGGGDGPHPLCTCRGGRRGK